MQVSGMRCSLAHFCWENTLAQMSPNIKQVSRNMKNQQAVEKMPKSWTTNTKEWESWLEFEELFRCEGSSAAASNQWIARIEVQQEKISPSNF